MPAKPFRILIVDDNENIHQDYITVLEEKLTDSSLTDLENDLFDQPASTSSKSITQYRLEHAYQGAEAIEKVKKSFEEKDPYSVAFVDVRMPPGLDGIETISQMWKIESEIQTVICTAFSDYSLNEIIDRLGKSDRLLILKKPFDSIEVMQMANALSKKWLLTQYTRGKEATLSNMNFQEILRITKENEELKKEIQKMQKLISVK